MSGIEVAGVVLAVLPLIVKLISDSREGLDTIWTLTSNRRYRRELERYENGLSTQSTIFRNALEQVLLRIIHNDEDIAQLLQNPGSQLWQRSEYNADFQRILGTSHGAYIATMRELVQLLQSLRKKLGVDSPQTDKIRELKRLKDVFSKAIYEALLDKIKDANQTLLTLIEQAQELAEIRKSRRPKRKLLQEYTKTRRHARSVHDTFVRGTCWKCACRSKHVLQLRLEPRPTKVIAAGIKHCQSSSKFTLHLVSHALDDKAGVSGVGEEVEIEAVELQDHSNAVTGSVGYYGMSHAVGVSDQKGVHFNLIQSTLGTIPWPLVDRTSPQIEDICSALNLCSGGKQRAHLGFLIDELHRRRHDIYTIRKLTADQSTRSVESILCDPSLCLKVGHIQFPPINQRNRRYLAATLASSVLQLHGSWIESQWGLKDILLPANADYSSNSINLPYISRRVVEESMASPPPGSGRTNTPALIRSGILFPLGLALVELSLGQSLVVLHEAEDDDPVEAVANLKTALRLLKLVLNESGDRYCNVVKTCLLWSGPDGDELDDEQLQSAVFEQVVMPLLEDLDDFEGKALIR